jgi:hypothetical protein
VKAKLLPDVVTPLAAKQVALAFRSAFETVVGTTPSNACLALMTAHSALETGRWKSIHCYNFGNIKAGPDYEGFYTMFRCNEVIDGKVVWFDPPHVQTNFRAFQSPEGGAIDHIQFLAQRKRYHNAWLDMVAGAPLAFVDSLKRAGYFTADAAPYSKAVASLWREYMPMVEQLKEPEPHPEPEQNDAAEALRAEALAAVRGFDMTDMLREERNRNLGEP